MAQLEGTSNNGENNNVEDNDFYKWMISAGAKHKLIVKLIDSGIDSMDMLEEVANDGSILDDTDLNKIEKAKIRTILKQLPNQLNIIDKEESEAMLKMEKKLKSLKTAINLAADTKQTIDEHVTNHTKSIQSTFKEMHQLLNEREAALIKKLNDIATKKKKKLDDISKTLNEQTNTSQKQITACLRTLKKSIEITQIEERKKQILNIAKNIDNIKIITKHDEIISNNKINVILDRKLMIKTINSFGNVFGGCLPVLISLIDNKNCSITVQWKLDGNEEKRNEDKNYKLKVEWNDVELKNNDDIKENDIDNEIKEEWKYNKEFILENEEYSTINVKVENKTTVYVFKLKYFDGKSWSINSNIKSIVYKAIVVNDKWDTNAVGSNIVINGDTVSHTGSGYQSAYLSNIVSEGCHIWKMKINKMVNMEWNPFGIWKTKSGALILNDYWSSQSNRGYGYALGQGYKIMPNKPGSRSADIRERYGECKAGDTITMVLDFNTLSLSYKVNGNDCGKAFDIEKTTYRAVITFGYSGSSYTLLSYHRQ